MPPAERLEATLAVLLRALITGSDSEGARIFGRREVEPGTTFGSLLKAWTDAFGEDAPWERSLVYQVMKGIQWAWPSLRWELMRSVDDRDSTLYGPVRDPDPPLAVEEDAVRRFVQPVRPDRRRYAGQGRDPERRSGAAGRRVRACPPRSTGSRSPKLQCATYGMQRDGRCSARPASTVLVRPLPRQTAASRSREDDPATRARGRPRPSPRTGWPPAATRSRAAVESAGDSRSRARRGLATSTHAV